MSTTEPTADAPVEGAPRRRWALPLVIVAALAVIALVAGGIWWWRSGDGSEEAEQLAAALESGDYSGLALAEGDAAAAAEEHERILGSLLEDSGASPQVEVSGNADAEGERALTLAWTWDLADDVTWEYETPASLARADGGWAARLDPAVYAPDLTDSEHLELDAVAAEAGEILDRDGVSLYGPRDVLVLGLDLSQLDTAEEEDAAARELADALGIDPDNFAATVEASGEDAFASALTIRAEDAGDYDLDAAEQITGYLAQEETMPLAAERDYAPGVLGSLREATAEDIEESEGEVAAGDLVATGGVTAARRDQLVGTNGLEVLAVDEDGAERSLLSTDPVAGQDVTITLDDELQRLATEAIAGEDSPAAVVALQPSTGDLLAAALGPESQEYPIGLVGQYAPGSTFKTVTSLGLLRAGLTPASEVQCPETAAVEGRSFKNADSLSSDLFGTMTLAEAVAHSCNTAMVLESDTVSQEQLAAAATTLGIGQETPEGLDAFMGSVDPEDTGTEHAAAMLGQGRVLASPLAMATVLASVQNGAAVSPRVLADDDSAAVEVDEPLTEDETAQMQEMLRGVVTDGSLDDFADLDGEPVIGKTGTAEWTDENGETKLHSWVIVAQGDLAIAVFVEDGSYGSVTAGPIAREVLEGAAGI